MENQIISFKLKPRMILVIILLVVLIVFVIFQLGGLRKPQKMTHLSEVVKEEFLPAAEIRLQAEEKPTLSLEKKFTIQVASFQDKARAEIVANGLKTERLSTSYLS